MRFDRQKQIQFNSIQFNKKGQRIRQIGNRKYKWKMEERPLIVNADASMATGFNLYNI